MKSEFYKLIFVILLFLFSCNYDTKNTDDYKLIKSPEQRFIAIFQKDSAFLKFKTMPNGEIHGWLVIKYAEPEPNASEKEFYHGKIIGKFTKDTLFADYIFADRAEKIIYTNPIVLLRKGNKLVLGFGAIETYLGRSWLINHQAINFTRGRFQFVPVARNN